MTTINLSEIKHLRHRRKRRKEKEEKGERRKRRKKKKINIHIEDGKKDFKYMGGFQTYLVMDSNTKKEI